LRYFGSPGPINRPPNPTARPGYVEDREDQAAAESRAKFAPSFFADEESGLDLPGLVESERREVRAERGRVPGRETQSESVGKLPGYLALSQVLTCRSATGLVPEHATEEVLRRAVYLPQRFAWVRTLTTVLHLTDLDSGLLRGHANRRRPVDAEPLLQKGEGIAALAADEAVEPPALRIYREVPMCPLVKRTCAAEARPHALE
jgi:hypothetical protein